MSVKPEHYEPGFVRTRMVDGQWRWRRATQKEREEARSKGIAVHKLFGEQPIPWGFM